MSGSGGSENSLGLGHEFELDDFQLAAIASLDAGKSVLVSAPTGAGKTVVAEFAVERALGFGGRAFYTTPIKALSNQKYEELVARYGRQNVGLLTGDNVHNSDAPVIVMTTEVLRNMIYADSAALDDLVVVVLDEVHYLQDRYRGPVWEEVIINLDERVQLVCLSATVSNAPEVAAWLTTVRGPTETVVEHHRPVDLDNLYLVADRESTEPHLVPILVRGSPNARAERFDLDRRYLRGSRSRRRFSTPRRVETVELLANRDMLPSIFFIFSRNACDDAVERCLDAGLRFTSSEEQARIRAIIEARTAALSDDDLRALGFAHWSACLEAGLAAHHAGMVPPFKEAVEACFAEGLVRVVFATETLALGINMPARSVVIEKLTKFTGETHEALTAAEYTQLTGRAGRRGIDERGFAVVLWSPFVPFGQVAALAASREFELRSAFRPTYNMAANLVRLRDPDSAHHLLNASFAQFQADRSVVRLERRLAQRRQDASAAASDARCERGDVEEYVRLLKQHGARGRGMARGLVERGLAALKPGDVIELPGPGGGVPAVVLTVAQRRAGATRVVVVTEAGEQVHLGARDFASVPVTIGEVQLPAPFQPDDRGYRRRVRDVLRSGGFGRRDRACVADHATGAPDADDDLGSHPVHYCPDRDRHVRAARESERAGAEVRTLERRIQQRAGSISRQFDRVLHLLEEWDYLDGWSLTERGDLLAGLYHECDLLVAESLASGLFEGLDAPSFAGLVSCLTYEHRSPGEPPEAWFPTSVTRERFLAMERLARDLAILEEQFDLPRTRHPSPTFFAASFGWTAGDPLDDLLEEEELSAGDFVRNIKQVVDLARQIGETAPSSGTRRVARDAASRLLRGIVAASSSYEVGGEVPGSGDDDGLPPAARARA